MNTPSPKLAHIVFEGNSRTALGKFPFGARRKLGYALFQLQLGEDPADSKPMKSIGQGVFELRAQDPRGWYRVVYLKKIKDRIFVLHSFEKQSRKTSRHDINLAQQRLTDVLARLKVEKNVTEI